MAKFLSVHEAAELSGVSDGQVRAWVACGELVHYRLGKTGSKKGRIGIAPADLEAFLRGRRVEAVPAATPAPAPAPHGRGTDFTSYYRRVMDEIERKRRR